MQYQMEGCSESIESSEACSTRQPNPIKEKGHSLFFKEAKTRANGPYNFQLARWLRSFPYHSRTIESQVYLVFRIPIESRHITILVKQMYFTDNDDLTTQKKNLCKERFESSPQQKEATLGMLCELVRLARYARLYQKH